MKQNKKKEEAIVMSQKRIATGVFDMWIETELAKNAEAGQFLALYSKDASRMLPRPISICEVDREKERLRLVYRIAGKGTEEFSLYQPGDTISILGILGNGFPCEEGKDKNVLLLGGGIGVPPILELSKRIQTETNKKQIVLGYRNEELFLKTAFEPFGCVYVATEDGSVGTRGNVLDVVREKALKADIIYACGPMPMLRAIKTFAEEKQIKAYISLEERMACGVGACLGCVCQTTKKDSHSQVNNTRICTEGPVFDSREVDI